MELDFIAFFIFSFFVNLLTCCPFGRHYYMKDVYMFIPEPKNNRAIVAISAIARAMKEMNKCAILRCVWRQGQGNVVIGVLTPNISSVDNIVSSYSSFVITSYYFLLTQPLFSVIIRVCSFFVFVFLFFMS